MLRSGFKINRFEWEFAYDEATLKHVFQILIRDRNSTHGTYVNDIRIVQQTLLQNGDILVSYQGLQAYIFILTFCRR